jgi:CelD/BcsL family acetyltransferase involved in cellulose biosynthesis
MATTSDTIGWADRFDRDTTAASEIDVRHWHRASRNPLPTARRAPPDNEFALITTRAEFDTLAGDWNSLFARCGRSTHAFQTFNWCSHWADHFLGGERDPTLAIVTARRRGRLVLVAPLVVERFAGLKIVTWLGAPVSQYGDIIAEEGPHLMPALRRAWAFLIDTVRPDAVRLNKTRADAVVGPLLGEIFVRTGESYENAGAPVPLTPSNRVLNRIALPTPSGPKSQQTLLPPLRTRAGCPAALPSAGLQPRNPRRG